MSASQIARDPSVSHLISEGYEVTIKNGHLIVQNIPYVDAGMAVRRGAIVCPLSKMDSPLGPPHHHQVWFVGEIPCYASGKEMEAIISQRGPIALWADYAACAHLSNKPVGLSQFSTYAEKILHYANLIEAQANVIDPIVTAKTSGGLNLDESEVVFKYQDMASVRASIVAVSDKLKAEKIGLVGLGGTGSYILDLVAKTPVEEIHLFDEDEFEIHNAFRAPGAASTHDLNKKISKVEYFTERYSPMRNGIVSHKCRINKDNIGLLEDMDFVFVSVDSGQSRRVICKYLQSQNIPFIDVGMDLQMNQEKIGLFGMFRVTLNTPKQNDHLINCIPTNDDEKDEIYRSNIQVADINMCNAAHAVICWKQYRQFYLEHKRYHHRVYTIFDGSVYLDVVET